MMGAYFNEFKWYKTTKMGQCPNCSSDVLKIRQHVREDEGRYQEGDLVECQCCFHEGVIEMELSQWDFLSSDDFEAKVVWDDIDAPDIQQN